MMISTRRVLSLLCVFILGSAGWGAASGQGPYVGYVYPAGGRQGFTFQVTIRGQRLSDVRDVYVSGEGVHASVVGYEGPTGPLTRLQQEELKLRLMRIRDARTGGQSGAKNPGKAASAQSAKPSNDGQPVVLPDLPELRNLETQTGSQLKKLALKFLNTTTRVKPPIAEKVTLEVTVDQDAAPGDRELRLRTPTGLTNPLVFQVGNIPEIREPDKYEDESALSPVEPPVVLNGQIMPGEVDRFPLQLHGGQKLVVAVQARKLIPYLADAVPGWFQAVVALHDSDGKEIAFDDDCGFDPDPALVFQAPHDGQYSLEVRDALYRGREDFVYRAVVADVSLARPLFPSGSRGGVPIVATHSDRALSLQMAREHFGSAFTPLSETEPNDTGQASMPITLPHIISGAIAAPGDKDVFRIEGHAGDVVVAEVYARRMGSPLDSLLRLIDASGRVVAWNDDQKDVESGLLTHHADSYLSTKLPATGRYYVQVSDAQRHGGPEYSYYLRIGPPRPDFALRVTPSSLNMPAGRAVTATVYALRKDGWDGDIDVVLKDAPDGFALSGVRIPRGRDCVRMTLTAPRRPSDQPVVLHMEGRAQIGGETVTRTVVPADDMMQAFAYRHLVPAKDLMVTTTRRALASVSLDMADGDRMAIPAGGSARVSFLMRPSMPNAQVHLELSDPPAGVTLGDVAVTRRGFTLTLKADDKHAGYADNLIVEAFTEASPKGKAGGSGQKQRVSLGVLPAVPFEIVPN
jgi:hypothetical protein